MLDQSGGSLHLVDVSDPARPRQIGIHDVGNLTYGGDVAGDLAYIGAYRDGLVVLDVGGCTCDADFDGNGVVDARDVLAFLNAWAAGGDEGDFNGDGAIDTRDVLDFLNAWVAGC